METRILNGAIPLCFLTILILDLGMEKEISGWKMVNAAQESYSYITGSCFLQGRNNPNEAWRTLTS